MAKFRLKIALLRTALAAFRGVGYVGKYVSIFFLWSFGGARWFGARVLWPIIRMSYRTVFGIRLRVAQIFGPLRGTFFGVLSHRHIIHIVVVIITIAAVGTSLSARSVHAEDFGTKSILYIIMLGQTEELIEEEAPVDAEPFPTESFAEQLAVSYAPAMDFDYLEEGLVSDATRGMALEAKPSRVGPSVAPRTEAVTYVVQEGDVISMISEEFGLSLATVLWANNLTVRSYIRPGDELTIPPLDGVMYKVKKGDTVEKLAKTYDAEKEDILAWNVLGEDGVLSVGETLMIPGGRMPSAPAPRIAAPSSVFTGARPPDGSSSGGGQLFWPLNSRRITQYYGWRHTGLDIGAPTGTAIYAADDGIVEIAAAGWNGGYGIQVLINHGNGMKTRYGHASKFFVKAGDRVTKGQTIAAVGSTGRSTGPHVHFEVIVGGKFQNPLNYIR